MLAIAPATTRGNLGVVKPAGVEKSRGRVRAADRANFRRTGVFYRVLCGTRMALIGNAEAQ